MDLSLQIIVNEQGETRDIVLGDKTGIGRGSLNRVQIKQNYISSRHATIRKTKTGEYQVEDCGSTNGTFINDEPVYIPCPIKPGDVLRFGLAACKVVTPGESDTIPDAVLPGMASEINTAWVPGGGKVEVSSYSSASDLVPKRKKKPAKGAKLQRKVYLASKEFRKKRPAAKVYDPFAARR